MTTLLICRFWPGNYAFQRCFIQKMSRCVAVAGYSSQIVIIVLVRNKFLLVDMLSCRHCLWRYNHCQLGSVYVGHGPGGSSVHPPDYGLVPQMWHETLRKSKHQHIGAFCGLQNTPKCVSGRGFAPDPAEGTQDAPLGKGHASPYLTPTWWLRRLNLMGTVPPNGLSGTASGYNRPVSSDTMKL